MPKARGIRVARPAGDKTEPGYARRGSGGGSKSTWESHAKREELTTRFHAHGRHQMGLSRGAMENTWKRRRTGDWLALSRARRVRRSAEPGVGLRSEKSSPTEQALG